MYIGMFNIVFTFLGLFMVYALLNNFEFKSILYNNTVYTECTKERKLKKKEKISDFVRLTR